MAGKAATALTVLDRCRISWGQVRAVTGDQVVVEFRPLTWDGRQLGYRSSRCGDRGERHRRRRHDFGDLAPGDWVSLHWEWICDRLTSGRSVSSRAFTAPPPDDRQRGNLHSGPAAMLGLILRTAADRRGSVQDGPATRSPPRHRP